MPSALNLKLNSESSSTLDLKTALSPGQKPKKKPSKFHPAPTQTPQADSLSPADGPAVTTNQRIKIAASRAKFEELPHEGARFFCQEAKSSFSHRIDSSAQEVLKDRDCVRTAVQALSAPAAAPAATLRAEPLSVHTEAPAAGPRPKVEGHKARGQFGEEDPIAALAARSKMHIPWPEFPFFQVSTILEPKLKEPVGPLVERSKNPTEFIKNANLLFRFSLLQRALPSSATKELIDDEIFMKGAACVMHPIVASHPFTTDTEVELAVATLNQWVQEKGKAVFASLEAQHLISCFERLKKEFSAPALPALINDPIVDAEAIRAWMKKTDFSKINKLNLSNQSLYFIPPGFLSHFPNLQELCLDNNFLNHLSAEVFALKGLASLSANHNNIMTLPSDLGEIINLNYLNLGFNWLSSLSLPQEISKLQNLKELLLFGNNFQDIPVEIYGLERLEELVLIQNPISDFPVGVAHLKNLTRLILDGTQIADISKGFACPEKLTELSLRHTPLARNAARREEIRAAVNRDYPRREVFF